jgi:hypothetical protein
MNQPNGWKILSNSPCAVPRYRDIHAALKLREISLNSAPDFSPLTLVEMTG